MVRTGLNGGVNVMAMRVALVPVAVLLLFGAGCDEKQSQLATAAFVNPAEPAELIRCDIRGEATVQQGQAPKITVNITNQTDADIYLVGSLDASDVKWRYPHCYFEVIGPDGKSAVQGLGRCGNMNTLREKDFVHLGPGDSFDPFQDIDGSGFFSAYQLNDRTFRAAGEYRVRFVYSTNSTSIDQWAGDQLGSMSDNEKLVGLFKQVPKLEVKSNEIRVTVVEAGR